MSYSPFTFSFFFSPFLVFRLLCRPIFVRLLFLRLRCLLHGSLFLLCLPLFPGLFLQAFLQLIFLLLVFLFGQKPLLSCSQCTCLVLQPYRLALPACSRALLQALLDMPFFALLFHVSQLFLWIPLLFAGVFSLVVWVSKNSPSCLFFVALLDNSFVVPSF